jgi:hypothetical protein
LFSYERLEVVERAAAVGRGCGPSGLFRLSDQFDQLVEDRAELRLDPFVSVHDIGLAL